MLLKKSKSCNLSLGFKYILRMKRWMECSLDNVLSRQEGCWRGWVVTGLAVGPGGKGGGGEEKRTWDNLPLVKKY